MHTGPDDHSRYTGKLRTNAAYGWQVSGGLVHRLHAVMDGIASLAKRNHKGVTGSPCSELDSPYPKDTGKICGSGSKIMDTHRRQL